MENTELQQRTTRSASGGTNDGRGNGSSSNGMGAPSSLQSIGVILRERREAANISLAEVEKATRIRQKYLAALEADEWHLLPGEVVGRGFLRNYSGYLKVDVDDVMDWRRSAADSNLARILSNTSAGSMLPPEREVDYRPKDVDLEEIPVASRLSEYLAASRDWFAPIVSVVALILVIFLIGWGVREVGDQAGLFLQGMRQRTSEIIENNRSSLALNTQTDEGTEAAGRDASTGTGGIAGNESGNGGDPGGTTGQGAAEPSGESPAALIVPPTPTFTAEPLVTATFTPEPPTATFTPELSPTATPEPPTATFTPEPPTPVPAPVEPTEPPAPQVVAPVCPDGRARITSPGVNQTVSGVVSIVGSASHDQFNFYKLEFASGANAEGGYGYFDGTASQIQSGVLGSFNSAGVPNGAYTIQLVVVDQTGNYPPPCRVTVQVQN